jgi:flagellar FliL protein
MAKDEKDKKDKTAEETPKKSKKKLLIIIIAAVVLLGGGGGAYIMLGSSSSSAAPPPVAGLVAPLDATTINLDDGHYLKLQMSLQATDKVAEAPDGSKALDVAINLYSNMSSATLLTAKGRDGAKAQLKELIIKAYTVDKEEEVMDVYFTAFVIQ